MTATLRLSYIRCWHCKGRRPNSTEDCLYCSRPPLPPVFPPAGTCCVCGRRSRSATDFTCIGCSRPDPPPRPVDPADVDPQGVLL